MSTLLDKIKKNSTIKETSALDKSKFFKEIDEVQTLIPAVNIALSGSLSGGLKRGSTIIAGPSRHFKSLFALIMAEAYLKKHKDSVCLFYDSEFGTPITYFESVGIDPSRVIHTPILNLEQLKFDIMAQLENIERGDKLVIIIDSLGNLASKKEVDDALEGKSVADMTRAKQMKSLFRMITPHLTIKDIPMIGVNHIYMEQGLYPKAILSGGCLVVGTKLRMFDESLKSIEDIVIGDLVKTLNGSKAVTANWSPETLENGEPECYEVEFEDGYRCIISENHPFLSNSGWIEAKNLKINDEIVCI